MTHFAIVLTLIVMVWAAPSPAQAPAAGSAAAAPQGNVENGKKLYVTHGCWTCHGYAAQGGRITLHASNSGPELYNRRTSWAAFSRYMRQPTGDMPPYTEKVLPDRALADIYAWLQSLPPPPPVSSIPQLKD